MKYEPSYVCFYIHGYKDRGSGSWLFSIFGIKRETFALKKLIVMTNIISALGKFELAVNSEEL